MSPTSRERFAAVVRTEPVDLGLACLLIAAQADPALDIRAAQAELDRLARSVDPRRPPVEALRGVLAGFTGDARDYADLRSSLLPEVLRRRAGLPILLSVVWLEVARRCGMPADGIGLPGHFVVRVGGGYVHNYVHNYVDPFAGGARLDVSGVPAPYLRPWDAAEMLLRILSNIRAWAGHSTDRARTRLWAVELSLLLPHHPVDLRRERGVLLVAGGDFAGGARELVGYAELVAAADPAAAERAREQAGAARARLN
jgi:regulator of sirC expression with transglutaminase-like and TPR domain